MQMNKITNPVFDDLKKVGLIKNHDLMIIQKSLRNGRSSVLLDSKNKFIFLEKYLVNDSFYKKVFDVKTPNQTSKLFKNKTNILNDYSRYFNLFKKFIKNKNILDYGCGYGQFLFLCSKITKKLSGVELSKVSIKFIKKKNPKINIESKINKFQNKFDIITLFHTLHYLPNQIETLIELKKKLTKKGKIIIEVPCANDALISKYNLKHFKQFTFCRESLIWHTAKSLTLFLRKAQFKNIKIIKVQRHNLNNHLGWILKDKPGGHDFFKDLVSSKKNLSTYNSYLIKNNLNDTLIAIANK